MVKQNRDRSKSRIVKMPQLHRDTQAADVWFEAGMVYFEDPKDPSEVASCTLAHFKDYIGTLREYVDDDETIKHFVCGRQAVRRFISDALDLIREVEPQLHVGLPVETISEVEASRAGITVSPGFLSRENEPLLPDPGFKQRPSGLIVPK